MINNTYNILVVEDDDSIRELYALKLSLEGFGVITAENGLIGLKLAKSHKPNLILLDIKMPIMGGEEMLTKLRQSHWGSIIRVIVLTNVSKNEAPHSLRFLHVDRYVMKAHHTPSQVISIVNEILG